MQEKLLSLQDVSFNYADDMSVLHGITLDINKNDLIIVRGESGAGKSTFLKLFNRFCDYSTGHILYHNKELRDYRIDQVRASIIYLPQLPCIVEGTIEENLSFPFTFRANSEKSYNPTETAEWLDHFQLDIPFQKNALELSTGQKQRIALIRAMLLKPEVLLLDEPASALDSNNRRLIEKKVGSMILSSEITVIMATHSEVSLSSDNYKSFYLSDGRLKLSIGDSQQ